MLLALGIAMFVTGLGFYRRAFRPLGGPNGLAFFLAGMFLLWGSLAYITIFLVSAKGFVQ